MNICVVGLGSMGKRRLRCLLALGLPPSAIAGVDPRPDRREEASSAYGVKTFSGFDEAARACPPDRLIISVPPDAHHVLMKEALRRRIPFFVEASVVDTDMDLIIPLAREAGVTAAPSATTVFHPGISRIREIVFSGRLGGLSNILFHSGQYLPDWHGYERVRDYYVSNPATGGCREIVPFELTWMVDIWGFPVRVAGFFRKTITIEGAEGIDDTYNCLLDYGGFMVNLSVDVVSRYATRRLLINGDQGQLRWDWDENCLRIFQAGAGEWERLEYDAGRAAPGYNPNIGEAMYIDEVRAFLTAADGGAPFVNTLERDHKVLQTLYAIERSDREGRMIPLPFAGRAWR